MKQINLRLSHLPVIRALGKYTHLQNVLEYGSGLHSTPEFTRLFQRVISVDFNEEWTNKVSEHLITLPISRSNTSCFFRDIVSDLDVGTSTYPDELTEAEFQIILHRLIRMHVGGHFDLLYIDCDAWARYLLILMHARRFPALVVHDTEKARYKTQIAMKIVESRFHFRYDCMIAGQPDTTVLIDKQFLTVPDLKDGILDEIERAYPDFPRKVNCEQIRS